MGLRNVAVAALLALGAGGHAAAHERGDHGHELHGPGHHHRVHIRHASIERAALHNIMAELLSAKTGRSVGEIQKTFDEADHPHDAVDALGLTHDDMRPLLEQAHEALLKKATAAGLITAAQADRIRAQPRRKFRKGPPAPDGEDG